MKMRVECSVDTAVTAVWSLQRRKISPWADQGGFIIISKNCKQCQTNYSLIAKEVKNKHL